MKRLLAFIAPLAFFAAAVSQPASAAAPVATPPTLIFEDTRIGDTSPIESVDLFSSNLVELVGITGPIEIIDPATGLVSDNFVIDDDDCTGEILSWIPFPGTTLSCDIDVEFQPDVVAVYNHELRITHSGSAPNPFIVPLNGVGYDVTQVPNPIDFGTIFHNRTSTITHTLTNVGPIDLMMDVVNLDVGTEFSIQSDSCSGNDIAPANSCAVDVEFDPTGVGTFPDTLEIDTFGYTGNPSSISFDVPITGTAVDGPGIGLSSTALDFGSVVEGDSSATQTVTLTNVGSQALTVTDVDLSVLGSPFAVTNTNCVTNSPIAVDGTCTITGQFNPIAPGVFNGSIDITSDSILGPSSIAVTGTGLPEGEPIIAANPASLDFGSVEVGDTQELTVTISNTGQQDLVIGQLGLSGINVTLFDINDDNCSNTTQNPGDSCTVDATFSPIAIGTNFSAQIDVPNNSAIASLVIALIGDGFITPPPPAGDCSLTAASPGNPMGWLAFLSGIGLLIAARRRK